MTGMGMSYANAIILLFHLKNCLVFLALQKCRKILRLNIFGQFIILKSIKDFVILKDLVVQRVGLFLAIIRILLSFPRFLEILLF